MVSGDCKRHEMVHFGIQSNLKDTNIRTMDNPVMEKVLTVMQKMTTKLRDEKGSFIR